MLTKRFWSEAFERAVKSSAQMAIAAFGAGATNLLEVPALTVLGAAGAGLVLSLLTSVASARLGSDSESPALVGSVDVEKG